MTTEQSRREFEEWARDKMIPEMAMKYAQAAWQAARELPQRERDEARRLAEEWKDYALWSSHRQPKPTILPWGNNQPERE